MNRRDFNRSLGLAGFGALALGGATSALAQAPAPEAGKQYQPVQPPVETASPGKIEVLEFFSYACPHCHAFEPFVAAWAAKLPADVAFHRVPVPFLMNAENFMRTYYALETIGQVQAMQPKLFSAIHVEHNYLSRPEAIVELLTKNGVDGTKFRAAFDSFSVATSVARAKKLVAAYKIDGVPALAVQGRWKTSPGEAGGPEQALQVVDYLVQQARRKA